MLEDDDVDVENDGDSDGCSFTPEGPVNNPGKYRVDREGDPPMSWG